MLLSNSGVGGCRGCPGTRKFRLAVSDTTILVYFIVTNIGFRTAQLVYSGYFIAFGNSTSAVVFVTRERKRGG